MIGEKCKHKITGHKGKITLELNDSWGIYWFQGSDGDEYAKHIKENGIINFWQDKNNIEILKRVICG
jgi:hypothetical protein